MLRSLLACALILASAGPAAACRLFDFIGFLDYRHSTNRWDDPGYGRYRDSLDRRREYVFQHMSAQEAAGVCRGQKKGRRTSTRRRSRSCN